MFYKSIVYVLYFCSIRVVSKHKLSYKTTPCYEFLFAANNCSMV